MLARKGAAIHPSRIHTVEREMGTSEPLASAVRVSETDSEVSSVDEVAALERAKSRVILQLLGDVRTPLMMIASPLQEEHEDLQGLRRRIQRYAGEIRKGLDRAVSILEMDLDPSPETPGESVDFVREVERFAVSRRAAATRQGIHLAFRSDPESMPVTIDRVRIRQFLDAVMDRALHVLGEGDVLRFQVATSRAGASHFAVLTIDHRDGGEPRETSNGAAALALAVGRRAVRRHGGRLAVDRSGGHASYRIELPITDTESPGAPRPATGAGASEPRDGGSEESTVLVVDDHSETRAFLRYALRKHHRILEAADGEEALRIVRMEDPDLVISDVMMPVMDGKQLCRAIKEDEALNHIPVFLVTASAVRTMKTESLASGADDYLVKPFDVAEAVMRINNEIEMRRRLRRRFSRELVVKASDITVTSEDEAFIHRARELVETNMEDSTFSVQDLASEMGFSSRQLQRRLRDILDQSPVEFIRTLRLQRAGQLLEARYGNVSEVAYSVGFTSLSYFAKCFKEHFGESPSAFKDSHSD